MYIHTTHTYTTQYNTHTYHTHKHPTPFHPLLVCVSDTGSGQGVALFEREERSLMEVANVAGSTSREVVVRSGWASGPLEVTTANLSSSLMWKLWERALFPRALRLLHDRHSQMIFGETILMPLFLWTGSYIHLGVGWGVRADAFFSIGLVWDVTGASFARGGHWAAAPIGSWSSSLGTVVMWQGLGRE